MKIAAARRFAQSNPLGYIVGAAPASFSSVIQAHCQPECR
jgi:hypothetical protein